MLKSKSNEKEKKQNAFLIVKEVLAYMLPHIWRFKKGYFFVLIFQVVINAASPFINIIFPAMLIDELVNDRDIATLIILVIIIITGNTVFDILGNMLNTAINKYWIRFEVYFNELISIACFDMDFEKTEDTTLLDRRDKAWTGMTFYSGGITGLLSEFSRIISAVLKITGSLTIIITGAPFLIIVYLICLIISSVINAKTNHIDIAYWAEISSYDRRYGYIYGELARIEKAKDLRLYNAKDMMMKKAKTFTDFLIKRNGGTDLKKLPYQLVDVLISSLKTLVSNLYLGWLVISKVISIGDFTMIGSAGSSFTSSLSDIVFGSQGIVKRSNYVLDYVRFMKEVEENIKSTAKSGVNSISTKEQLVIEFKNVSFRYPKSEDYVLKNVSLTLNHNERISIVGQNGTGKTTFIKLLCRLYEVNEGEILINGVNINTIAYEEYTKLFSVVFQDFRLFAFSFKENITLSNDAENEEINKLMKLVGLSEKMESLPNGINTSVFKNFDENGIEPSGGEMQKLAIARALYKNAPIVILDEPTAALDPIAEYDIYKNFDTLVGGKTAVYISHRLSSCRFCDRIVVFKNGEVVEMGTHDDLYNKTGGVYAEMFQTQAQYYK